MTAAPAKILIADDTESHLGLLEQFLLRANYGVAKARDGIEALDKFEKYQPDLVILDLLMPRLSGLDVCTRLKQNPGNRNTPVLLLTSLTESETRTNAFDGGADDFLGKPFHYTELIHRVRSLLRLRQFQLTLEHQRTGHARARTELAAAITRLEQIRQPQAVPVALLDETLAVCKRLDAALAQM